MHINIEHILNIIHQNIYFNVIAISFWFCTFTQANLSSLVSVSLQVTSYGGNLNFTKKYTSLENPPHIHNTDVVLFGSTVLLFWVDEEHTSPDVPRVSLELVLFLEN